MNPSNPSTTTMVASPKSTTQMVKIRAKSPIRLYDENKNEIIVNPGEETEVTEAQAKEFCDKQIDIGYKNTFGERDKRDIQRTMVIRAERVK